MLKGAYGAFAVTNFWETTDPDVEIKQGKNVADAAKVCFHRSSISESRANESRKRDCGIWSGAP